MDTDLVFQVAARDVQQVKQVSHVIVLEPGQQPLGLLQLCLLTHTHTHLTVSSTAADLCCNWGQVTGTTKQLAASLTADQQCLALDQLCLLSCQKSVTCLDAVHWSGSSVIRG